MAEQTPCGRYGLCPPEGCWSEKCVVGRELDEGASVHVSHRTGADWHSYDAEVEPYGNDYLLVRLDNADELVFDWQELKAAGERTVRKREGEQAGPSADSRFFEALPRRRR